MRTWLKCTIALVVLVVALSQATAANADWGDGQGSQEHGRLSAWAYYLGMTGGGAGPVPQPCTVEPTYLQGEEPDPATLEGTWTWVPAAERWQNIDRGLEDIPPGTPGHSWERRCVSNTDESLYSIDVDQDWLVWVLPGDPATWGEFSFGTLGIEEPRVVTSPSSGAGTLVNFDTWAWIEGGTVAPQNLTITAGPVAVNLWAQPQSIVVDWGDGSSGACPGGGAANQPVCTHQYLRASEAYTISIIVTWTGGFDVSIGGVGVGGRAFAPEPYVGTTQIRVAESQAVVTGK